MIMTLAMATFLQGLLILIAGGTRISLENPLVTWLGNARPAGIPADILLWLVVSAAVLVVMHATPFGARVFALGANPLAAALSGVPVNATTIAVYGISGFTAGLAGVLVLGMNGQGYVGIGDPYLLASIAAVVLGGTSILGGLRHLCRHDSRRAAARHDHRADHRSQCLAGLAQHPVRLADPRAVALVGQGVSAPMSDCPADRAVAPSRRTARSARPRRARRRW